VSTCSYEAENLIYIRQCQFHRLTNSVKIIAKITSKFRKPDGLTVVRPEDVLDFVFPLDVSKIPGIGEKTLQALKLMGITKVKELAN
jgi:nucleotidyltransferase/DNA polymerase involved in DNA repair